MSATDRARKRDRARLRDLVTGQGERVELRLVGGASHVRPSSRIVPGGVLHVHLGGGRFAPSVADASAYARDATLAGRDLGHSGRLAVPPSPPKRTHGPVVHRPPARIVSWETVSRMVRANPSPRRRVLARLRRAELRSESDDRVRCEIEPHLLALFERVKRGIKATPRATRSEVFAAYVHEHPDEVWGALERHAQVKVRRELRGRV